MQVGLGATQQPEGKKEKSNQKKKYHEMNR
jgi:hypothetical protein